MDAAVKEASQFASNKQSSKQDAWMRQDPQLKLYNKFRMLNCGFIFALECAKVRDAGSQHLY